MYVHHIWGKSHFLHLEFPEVGTTFLSRRSHNVQEVWCEYKGNPLLTDSHEALIIPQDVAKVDVEKVSCKKQRGCSSYVHVHRHSRLNIYTYNAV